ncbi:TrbG/VirB9 family P-type conjugative transfer protein [Herbaspirillum sp. SJZ107]|uniref:TrbG/VirB9 family P-type conjugative transfer protein n=1 Tax=Herbaspirillum sp. SJZ107 TaxID=2572881 RepID=UPI0011539203|nr:TrbG/VirB9 family P-type conjugative transfer protein [Herbaspirillum sp. SJZ107]TQK07824.1 type IV secretion system protein VirB9 [Herbaspirillum sp. SJZ107]
MNKRILSCLTALTLLSTAHAAQEPEPSKGDPRIRYVTYDPNNVVLIYSKVGASLLIQFQPDEQLVDMVGGDVDAWGAASTKARNGIFLKPAAVLPETNIQVITNRRTYNFEVKLAPKGKPNYLTVRFRYPDDERKAISAATESDQVRALLDAGSPAGNRRYTVQGSSELAPLEAWDDGRTTFLRFRARASVPAIYVARGDDESLEQIESPTTQDDVVQIPGVRRKLVLRIGRQVACIFNEGFDAHAARPATNTASPYVKRTLKGTSK